MSKNIVIPAYYQTRKWQNSVGKMPFMKRIQDRVEEIEKRLPSMSLKEKQDLWKVEPYWEISEKIISSKDWVFPK